MNVGDVDGAAEELPDFFGELEDGGDEADIFDAAELEAAPETPAAEAGEGEADSEVSDAGQPKTVPYKRLQKVVAERNAARERIAALEAEESKLRAEVSGHQEFRRTVADRYTKFRNPTAQLALDADFMSAMEELAKSDTDVNVFYKKVMKYMESGERPKPQQQTETAAAQPGKDPRYEKLLEREARRTISDVLGPLKLQPKYARLVENHVVQSAKDLAEITPEQVKSAATAWLKTSGFTLAEMREAAKDDKAAAAKPPTGRQKGVSAQPGKTPSKKAAADPAKGRAEWLAEREQKLSSLLDELMAPQQ